MIPRVGLSLLFSWVFILFGEGLKAAGWPRILYVDIVVLVAPNEMKPQNPTTPPPLDT